MSDALTTELLGSMTLSRLYEVAREHDVKNPRKYKKQELIDLIVSGKGDSDGPGETGTAAPAGPVRRPIERAAPREQAPEADGQRRTGSGAEAREDHREAATATPRDGG